jgi:hypothetical protein
MHGAVEKRSASSTTPTGLRTPQDLRWSRRFHSVGVHSSPPIISPSLAQSAIPRQTRGGAAAAGGSNAEIERMASAIEHDDLHRALTLCKPATLQVRACLNDDGRG